MRYIMAALTLSFLAACTQAPVIPYEPLDVSGPPYRLNVASVNVVKDYISPKRLPNVEHLADVSPAQAVKKWAAERLIAGGSINTLEVDVKDASILRKDLPKKTSGIEGAFTTEQTEEYDGSLEVEIKIYNAGSVLPVAHLSVAAHQVMTLPDDAAPIDREHLYHRMTVELMKTIVQLFNVIGLI